MTEGNKKNNFLFYNSPNYDKYKGYNLSCKGDNIMPSELVYENEKLIYSIINKYRNYFDLEDLYQDAVEGLIKAYKKYKDDMNTKFSSFAYFYIMGEIKKYLREQAVIKVNKDTIKLKCLIDKTSSYLCQKFQREPTVKEIACFLDIKEDVVLQILSLNLNAQSLDKEFDFDSDSNLYNTIRVDEKYYDEDILDLKIQMEKLSDIDRKIINERYINDLSQSEV